MGYEVKYGPRVKHMAVRHQDSKRFVRLDGVAPQFSEAELREFFTQLKKFRPKCSRNIRQKTSLCSKVGRRHLHCRLCAARAAAAD